MNSLDLLVLVLLLKGLLLTALAAAAAYRAEPASRVRLLRGLMLTLLALPALAVLGEIAGLNLTITTDYPPSADYAGQPLTTPQPIERNSVAIDPLSTSGPGLPWLVSIWFLGAVVGWIRLALQLRALKDIRRRARFEGKQRVGGRRVLLGWSDQIVSPVSFGWRKPVVLLPEAWRQHPDMSATDIQHAVAHELAHVARGDWLWLLVVRMAAAAHWCNPLLPRVTKHLAEETEIVCDRSAVDGLTDTAAYAQTLLKALAVSQSASRFRNATASSALAMTGTDQWRRRIEQLYRREAPMYQTPLRLSLAAAIALPLAAGQLSFAQTEPVPAPEPTTSPAPASVSSPIAPASPTPMEGAAPRAAEAPEAAPTPAAAPVPTADPAAPEARRAEATRVRERAAAERAAVRGEAARLRAEGMEMRAAERARARAAQAEVRAEHERMRASRDEARRANQAALKEQERLARQLEQLQDRIAEIEAELAASKERNSER